MQSQARSHSSDSLREEERSETLQKKSYFNICVLIFVYGLSLSLAVPAFPKLTLNIVNGNESKAAFFYGLGTFVRYIVEFFFAPLMGTIADVKGRRIVLLLSYIVNSSEYLLLAAFPSLPMLFICRTISGIGDTGIATSYTIFSDIATYNHDDLTVKFGELSGVFGISFLIGPALGGYLTDISVVLCLAASGVLACFSAILCFFIQEETVHFLGQVQTLKAMALSNQILSGKKLCLHEEETPVLDGVSSSDYELEQESESISFCARIKLLMLAADPFPSIKFHLRHVRIRQLLMPLFTSNLVFGIGAIWYLYMDTRFNVSAFLIGVFLSVWSLGSTIYQGLLLKRIIPKYWSHRQAIVNGFLVSSIQFLGIGFTPVFYGMFFCVLLAIGSLADPSLKGLIVEESLKIGGKQGNLQGTLTSLRTLATAVGSLAISALFAFSINLNPRLPFLCFVFAALVYIGISFYFRWLFSTKGWSNDSVDKGLLDNQNRS